MPSIPPIPAIPLNVDFNFALPPLPINPQQLIAALIPKLGVQLPPLPPLPDQLGAGLGASVPVTPLICGLKIPGLNFNVKRLLKIPPVPVPSFFFAQGLPCNLGTPLAVSFGPGGGRRPQQQITPYYTDSP